jgi:hypothetical protein
MRNLLISLMSTDDRKSTSYHEAAHAVFNELAGIPVRFVTALPFYDDARHGWVRGVAMPVGEVFDFKNAGGYIQGILAGDLAQKKAGSIHAEKTDSDQGQLERFIAQVNTKFGTAFTAEQTYLEFAPHAQRKLDDPIAWAAIEALAARLQEVEVVQGDEVREITARYCEAAKAAGA